MMNYNDSLIKKEEPLASISERFFALIIDQIIVFIISLISFLFVFSFNESLILLGISFLIIATIIILYIIPSFVWSGQTIGKKILGIKAVREDGSELSKGYAFLRQIVHLGLNGLTGGIVEYISGIMVLINPSRKTIHDIICKTKVVSIFIEDEGCD